MDQDFHLIEKYFRGELSEEELQLFNEKLQKDSKFEQEFRDMKLIREGAKASARSMALSILQDAEAGLTKKETTKINVSMRRLVSIAASLIVIATISYFAISDRTGGTMTGDEVFTAYYETYPNIVSGKVRGENIEINTLSARAYNAYDIKDFSTSANLFAELLAVEKSAENFFYSGIANLEAGKLEVAKANFSTVINNYSQMSEQSRWFMAMTLLKDGKAKDAAATMGALSATNSSYKRDANNVLNSLNFKLLEVDDDGTVTNVELLPPGSQPPPPQDNPDGSIQQMKYRQYQVGELLSNVSSSRLNFLNELPIFDLSKGDKVHYIILRSRSGEETAVILDKIQE